MADKLLLDGEPVLMGRFAAAQRHRVLVADANAAHADVIVRRLRAEGFGAATADAADAALRACELDQPDLLLLDWGFADGGAATLLRALRGERRFADLPVLAVTARSDRGAAVDALAGGADDYLAKPYDWELLFARSRRLLGRSATLANLRRADAALGARAITSRAAEIAGLRARLEETLDESRRLDDSLRALERELGRPEAPA